MFSSGGDCSLLFFQDLLLGSFPFHLVTVEVNVCTVGFSVQSCCVPISVELQERRRVQRARQAVSR